MTRDRLPALTSLRFFAALMIVFIHIGGKPYYFPLQQGVSFFYVLSGFILTYSYPVLGPGADTRRFLIARFVRIWPLHLAMIPVVFLLIPREEMYWLTGHFFHDASVITANVFLVQAWIPKLNYYFSVNGDSWSVSVELFFYLAFPLLVQNIQTQWRRKLAITGALLLLMLAIGSLPGIPAYKPLYFGVTTSGLVQVMPLARLFEFTLGMCMAVAYGKRRGSGSALFSTRAEVAALALVLVTMPLSIVLSDLSPLKGPSSWLIQSGSFASFAFLILVMAGHGGAISRFLSHPWLEKLGEASFSLYLTHEVLVHAYEPIRHQYLGIPQFLEDCLLAAALVALSLFVFRWFEDPVRRYLKNKLSRA